MINSITLNEKNEKHSIAPKNAAAARASFILPPPECFRFFGQRILFTSLSFHNIPNADFLLQLLAVRGKRLAHYPPSSDNAVRGKILCGQLINCLMGI